MFLLRGCPGCPRGAPGRARHHRRHVVASERASQPRGMDGRIRHRLRQRSCLSPSTRRVEATAARLVEWTGGRRPPGDEVARSTCASTTCTWSAASTCRATSPTRHRPGSSTGCWPRPGTGNRPTGTCGRRPTSNRALYAACRTATGLDDLPADPADLTAVDRQRLRRVSRDGRIRPRPGSSTRLCAIGSAWRRRALAGQRDVAALPGTSGVEASAHRERHLLLAGGRRQAVVATAGGQPLGLAPGLRIPRSRHRSGECRPAPGGLVGDFRERDTAKERSVEGHVEVRWSHGRFAQPPEAKIYLDTATDEVPGYFALGGEPDQPRLWD